MSKLIDLTGQRFGRLTVIERQDRTSHGHVLWLCRCDCGKEKITSSNRLRKGECKSCGCLNKEAPRIGNYKHGERHTRLYSIWAGMKARCTCPSQAYYKDYGGRGIKVCDEWAHNFTAFRDWALANGYTDELTIDRIDNEGNYEPNNCRWATWHEQRINQRPRKKGG